MCRSKAQGGQRCATHAAEALARAEANFVKQQKAFEDAAASGDNARTTRAKQYLRQAGSRRDYALKAYASTNEGQQDLLARIASAQDPKVAEALQAIVNDGVAQAAKNAAVYSAWKDANKNTTERCPVCSEVSEEDHQCAPFAERNRIEPSALGSASFSDLTKEERAEKVRQELDAAVARMGTKEGWQAYLNMARTFHTYSFTNQILIAIQCPNATLVKGANSWKKDHERFPAPGTKAIYIRAPRMAKREVLAPGGEYEEKNTLIGFLTVPVFDVSQTAGKDLPERPDSQWGTGMSSGETPPKMMSDLTRVAELHGYTVEFGDTGDAGGYTEPRSKKIVISSKSHPRRWGSTLAHEVGHVVAGHTERSDEYHSGAGGSRPEMEIEADSIAYVISREYGYTPEEHETESFAYVDSWAKGDPDKVQKTAEAVNKYVKAIYEMIDKIDEAEKVTA